MSPDVVDSRKCGYRALWYRGYRVKGEEHERDKGEVKIKPFKSVILSYPGTAAQRNRVVGHITVVSRSAPERCLT